MIVSFTTTGEQKWWLQSDIWKKNQETVLRNSWGLGINCFDNRGQELCWPDLLKFWLCDVVLPQLIPLLSKFWTIHSLILMGAAGNSSYLLFSDEEIQAGGYMTRVKPVKKPARGKTNTRSPNVKPCIPKEAMEKYHNWKTYCWISSSIFDHLMAG